MAKSYCLTIEIKSEQIAGGLGYMIAFRLPDDKITPEETPGFATWRDAVRQAVMALGDQAFHPDPYTKKLAIANLMHDLDDINRHHAIQIGFCADAPAVQIHSTNPFDNQIDIDFTDEDGHFRVDERNPALAPTAHVAEQGKTGIIEAGRKNFPFNKPPEDPRPSSAAKPPAKTKKPKP